jgi:hypothetical protein
MGSIVHDMRQRRFAPAEIVPVVEPLDRDIEPLEAFRRLLNHPRLKHAAFIAETPIDEPGDDLRNVATLRSLVTERARKRKRALGP